MKGAEIVHQRLEGKKKTGENGKGRKGEIVQRLRRKVRWWDCVLEREGMGK